MDDAKRMILVANIKDELQKVKELKLKQKKLNTLSQSNCVQKYLKLKQELDGQPIKDDKNLIKNVFLSERANCHHDVYLFMGGYKLKENNHNQAYLPVSDYYEMAYFEYFCLECYKRFFISRDENAIFIKNKQIIKLSDTFLNMDEYMKIQDAYFNLLYKYPTKESFTKLKKKLAI